MGTHSNSVRRAVLLHDHLGYARDSIHGVTSYFAYVIPELKAQGLTVELCVLSGEHSSGAWFKDLGIRCTFLNSWRGSPATLWPLSRYLHEVRPDVVHAAGFKSILMSRLIAARMHIGSVLHLHDKNSVPAWMFPAQRLLGPSTGAAIACSEAVASVATQFGVPRARTHVLHNALPIKEFASASRPDCVRLAAELGLAANARVVSVVGQLTEGKGQHVLLEALPLIRAQEPGIVVLFAGAGPQLEELQSKSHELGVEDHVRWLGFRRDVPQILSCSEVLVIPSVAHEAFGYPIIEANAVGLPVVGSNIGGIPEVVVDRKTGLLVPPGDSAALANALNKLLKDKKLRDSLARRAKERVRLYDVRRHARRLIGIYEQAAEFAEC